MAIGQMQPPASVYHMSPCAIPKWGSNAVSMAFGYGTNIGPPISTVAFVLTRSWSDWALPRSVSDAAQPAGGGVAVSRRRHVTRVSVPLSGIEPGIAVPTTGPLIGDRALRSTAASAILVAHNVWLRRSRSRA